MKLIKETNNKRTNNKRGLLLAQSGLFAHFSINYGIRE